MRIVIVILCTSAFISCNKNIEIKLPEYKSQIAIEMYLEDWAPLTCLVSESLPYSSDSITEMINNAKVIFSDGVETDTLLPANIYNYISGRHYNYSYHRIFFGDSTKTYTLRVVDTLGREITASTKTPPATIKIDSLFYSSAGDKYSVGLSFKDLANVDNYYRVIIGKGVDNYTASNTDVVFSDITFGGKEYAFNSKAGYDNGDTVTVRIYTLLRDHYNYLQSVESAQTATYNPFVQPVQTTSNITGGQGIFTAIRYDEKQIVIR